MTAFVILPWPPKGCSPNARSATWHKHAKAKKRYREICGWTCKAAGNAPIRAERLNVKITFYPPDARQRNHDNMIASFKAGQDGVADAVGVPDERWNPTYAFGAPRRPDGAIEVVLEAAP